MKKLLAIPAFLLAFFLPYLALAQTTPAPASPDSDFFAQVLQLIGQFGGLPWMAKVSGIVLLLIASMKVSFLQPLWAKLGNAQAFVAPALGLIGGILSMGTTSFSWAGLLAYIGAGAGALLLHELLDAVKGIPGIGSAYVGVINIVEGLLGGAPAPPATLK